jgi:hypothetical protein
MNKKKAYGLVQEFTNRSAATMDGMNAFSLQYQIPVTYLIPRSLEKGRRNKRQTGIKKKRK